MWIAFVVSAALILALGVPAAVLLGSDELLLTIGSAWLLGCAAAAAVLAVLSPIGWNVAIVSSVAVVASVALAVAARRKRAGEAVALSLFDLVPLCLIAAHLRYAIQPWLWMWEEWSPSRRDFFFIWGARARLFFESRGIDLAVLQHTPNDLSHPDYPWLWPLTIDFSMLFRGTWEPRIAGLLTTAFGAATLLILRHALGREVGPRIASFGTSAAAAIALPVSAGFAEAPFIAYASAGILMVRQRHLLLGSVLLGCAALTKNEGLALLVAVAIALAVGEKGIRRLWPAALVVAPWLVVRVISGLPTDLFAGDVVRRAFSHVVHPSSLLSGFGGAVIEQQWFFFALSVALLVAGRRLLSEQFIIVVVVLQFLFDVAAYVISPLDAAAHIVSSWGRLMAQLAIPLLFAAIAALGRTYRDEQPLVFRDEQQPDVTVAEIAK